MGLSISSPLPTPSDDMRGELYTLSLLRKNSSVHIVAVAWFYDALVLTSLSSSALSTTNPFFIIP
jgi:hypothetical protein